MAKMASWHRAFDDFFTHPKSLRLTNDQQRVVEVAWCFASRSPQKGVCLINQSLPANVDDIAREARLPVDVVTEALGTPESPGIVCQEGMFLKWRPDGVLLSPNWDERQFLTTDKTNAERQSRFREKRKKQPPEPDG